MAEIFDRKRLAPLKDTVAIVGVGETDYGADYRGAGGKARAKGEARYDSYTLASRALKRASVPGLIPCWSGASTSARRGR